MSAESILKRAYMHKADMAHKGETETQPIYKSAHCRVCLIRENESLPQLLINSPERAYELVKEELVSADRETLLSIMLDTKLYLVGIETVAMGSINACGSTGSEIFRGAILANCPYIVLAHNHPSGNLEPSSEDVSFTRNTIQGGKILGITVHDHLIVSSKGFISMRDKGLINMTTKAF